MVLRPPTATAPGVLLEMQIPEPYSTPTESETLRVDPAMWVLTNPPGDADSYSSQGITDLYTIVSQSLGNSILPKNETGEYLSQRPPC